MYMLSEGLGTMLANVLAFVETAINYNKSTNLLYNSI
jgi:hypothetical protein